MKLIIENQAGGSLGLSLTVVRKLYRVAVTTLATERQKRDGAELPRSLEICLTLTTDSEIRELNRTQRGLDKPTDVLSFPMFEATEPILPHSSLGDIVISVERAGSQAREYGHSELRELCFLFAHGLLHLLGYDHELSEAEEKLQFARQDEILTSLGIVR